jgi:hypothetical protein
MPRPSTTLIYVSRKSVARADFRGASLAGFWMQARPDQPDLPSAVELGISLGPTIGRRVWVLTSDLWTQTLAMPAIKAGGLAPNELAGALNFEVEASSGVSALEASVAHLPLPAIMGSRDHQYWLCQHSTADIDFIDELIRRDGGRLVGIIHPGGLPVPMKLQADGTPFGRVELWPDMVVGLWKAPNLPPTIRIWNADPSTDRWQAEAAQWRASTVDSDRFEWLTADGFTPPAGIAAGIALNEEANLSNWLTTWANTLSGRQKASPILRPVVQPMKPRTRWTIAAGLGLLAAGACAAHWYVTERQIESLHTEAAANNDKSSRLADAGKQIEAKNKERDQKKIERTKRANAANRLEARRTRFAQFLKLLAESKPDDMVIQTIDNDGGTTKVIGLTLRPELADTFARSLHDPLRTLGWEVQPASELAQPQRSAAADGLWRFELLVRDAAEPKILPTTRPRN